MTWNEHLHPRDPDDGRFIERRGGWLAGVSDLLGGGGDATLDTHYRPSRDMREELDYDQLVHQVNTGGHKDDALGAIWAQGGQDGLPRVVDQGEMDRLVASGWHELWRAVGQTDVEGQQYADQFRTGEPFPGLGGYGNGTYAMPNWRKQAAQGYGYNIMRMALRPDARIAENGDILTEMRDQGYTDFGASATDSTRNQVLSEVGRYASAAGYDAVALRQLQPDGTRSGSIVEWLILNRTALAVQDTDWLPYG